MPAAGRWGELLDEHDFIIMSKYCGAWHTLLQTSEEWQHRPQTHSQDLLSEWNKMPCNSLWQTLSTLRVSCFGLLSLLVPTQLESPCLCPWLASRLWDPGPLSAKWIVLLEAHQPYLWAVTTWQFDSHLKAMLEPQGHANVLINSSVSLGQTPVIDAHMDWICWTQWFY